MRHISVASFKEVIKAEAGNTTVDFINVCTPLEYRESHIAGVRNVPLDEINDRISEFSDKQTIFVHCRSGKRATNAIEKLKAGGVKADLVNVEGGLMAWTEAGFSTEKLTKRLPLLRQVLLIAGLTVLSSVLLGYFLNTWFLMIAALMGVGLTFAGATGRCGMSSLLIKMPWNK